MTALRSARFRPPRVSQTAAAATIALAGLLQAGCASLPTDYPRTPSAALADTADTPLGRMSRRLLAGHPDTSGVLLLDRGTDAFLARLALTQASRRSLDIQYYIWRPDTTGKVLAAAVLQAAERGVRVRLLLDDIGTAADDRELLAIDSHPNVEVRLFNPVATRRAQTLGLLADFSRANRRMHNKSFSADNQAMIIGGRNIGDEYFEARPDIEFADLDLLAIGPVVDQVSRQFDAYWNSPLAYPIAALSQARPSDAAIRDALAGLRAFVSTQKAGSYAQALRSSGLAEALAEGSLAFSYAKARALADDPAKIMQQSDGDAGRLLPKLLPEFESLHSELVLVSPYFVPGKAGVDRLRGLVQRGVRVRVLTNSLASMDVPAVYAGYRRYRRALLEAGVELYELKPSARPDGSHDGEAKAPPSGSSQASLHAKSMAFDRRSLFVGSMNLDPRSVFTNTETGVMVEEPGLVGKRVEQLDRRLPEVAFRLVLAPPRTPASPPEIEWVATQDGKEVRYAKEPMTRPWQRFKVWLYSLLPIEPLL